MKKLMIAAAAAALVGGAFADCQEDTACVFAYQVSLSGKSTVAVATKANLSACVDASCYRKVGSYKVKGYVWGATTASGAASTCDEACDCNDLQVVTTYLWNTKTLAKQGDLVFDAIYLVGSTVGLKAKTAEVTATLDGLKLAGFGKYDTKNLVLKSATGYFAGTVDAPECVTCAYNTTECQDECVSVASKAFAICTLDEVEAATTPAYGKWSIKYSKSAVKKLTKNYAESAIVPVKVLAANALIDG